MQKIDKEKWFTAGFVILEREGFSKITIDRLCGSLGITKGAFYHRFKNIDGYIEALMHYWLECNTHAFIRGVEGLETPERKRRMLADRAAYASNRCEEAIRGWGHADRIVRSYVEQADRVRLEYLTTLNIESGLKPAEARDMATVQYALLVGMQQICPALPPHRFKALQDLVIDKFSMG